jgi:hypothetical protein
VSLKDILFFRIFSLFYQLDFSVREEQQISTNSVDNFIVTEEINDPLNDFDIEVKEEKIFQPIV